MITTKFDEEFLLPFLEQKLKEGRLEYLSGLLFGLSYTQALGNSYLLWREYLYWAESAYIQKQYQQIVGK